MNLESLNTFKQQFAEHYGAESEITQQFNALCDSEHTPLKMRLALARIICRELLSEEEP